MVRVCGLFVAALVAATVVADVTLTAGEGWTPFSAGGWVEAGSALDFSAVRQTGVPAGKYGRVVAKGENFEFENLPGVPQRFYGVNVCMEANFPEYEDARTFAAGLARMGYNAIRLHHHDTGVTEGSADGTGLNAERMRKLDGLIAACIENGIYVTTDLYVTRKTVPFRAIGIDKDGMAGVWDLKELIPIWEPAFSNYLAFARNFLNHVNPYTGRSLAREPALVTLALINEGNLGNKGQSRFCEYPVYREKYFAWLDIMEKQDPKYREVKREIPEALNLWDGNHTLEQTAFQLFLADVEAHFARRMRRFLRDELGMKTLLGNMSCWFFPSVYQLPRMQEYDYLDDHFYVDHPEFPEKPWSLPSTCPNANPLRSEKTRGVQPVATRRDLSKPLTISEWNYSGPGRFRGLGGIVTGATAALQNWGGLWRFAWSHDLHGLRNPLGKEMGYFEVSGDPLAVISECATICLYLRRDLPELERTYVLMADPKRMRRLEKESYGTKVNWYWAGWYRKTGMLLGTSAPDGVEIAGWWPEVHRKTPDAVRRDLFPSAPDGTWPAGGPHGEVTADRESGAFLIRTPRTCGGFRESGTIGADALTAELDGAATVWASSLDSRPIRETDRILVAHLTDVQNTGITYADESLTKLLKWGGLPYLMRNGRAKIALDVNAGGTWRVYQLETSGRRHREVPCAVEGGRLTFTADTAADPTYASFVYELERKKTWWERFWPR